MPDNKLEIPELNPIIFYDINRANLSKYFTKYMQDYMFSERLYYWQQRTDYCQVWQVEDIIKLQFESTFDPIIVNLLDKYGNIVIALPALIGLPNIYEPLKYSFEISMSLAGLLTDFYYLQIIAGINGPSQRILISDVQYISAVPLNNTLLLEYFNSKFHKDVIFETGIKFQYRVYGVFGFLDKQRKDQQYRDQKYTPALLKSRSAKQWPVHLGIKPENILYKVDDPGLPDDVINLIDEILSCDNVYFDNKLMGLADGSKIEYITVDDAGNYPKRGLKIILEEGINRNSRLFGINLDPTKKLSVVINADAQIFGDTGNQGSGNTVPIYNAIKE